MKKNRNQDLLNFYVSVIVTVFNNEISNNSKYATLKNKRKFSKTQNILTELLGVEDQQNLSW